MEAESGRRPVTSNKSSAILRRVWWVSILDRAGRDEPIIFSRLSRRTRRYRAYRYLRLVVRFTSQIRQVHISYVVNRSVSPKLGDFRSAHKLVLEMQSAIVGYITNVAFAQAFNIPFTILNKSKYQSSFFKNNYQEIQNCHYFRFTYNFYL